MAQSAQQYAPETKPNKPQQQPRAAQPQEKPGMREKLHRLPQAAGIAAMGVLLALSLLVGNFRALQIATPEAFIRRDGVQSIIEDRIAQAGNVVTVATRAGLDAQLIADVSNAMEALEEAKSAQKISRADQQLTAAVAELTTAPLTGEDAATMQRAADNFTEQGNFLRQEARSYNAQAMKAKEVYRNLPTRALFSEPDFYEGI